MPGAKLDLYRHLNWLSTFIAICEVCPSLLLLLSKHKLAVYAYRHPDPDTRPAFCDLMLLLLQLSVACSTEKCTASDNKLGGAWEQG